MNKTIRFFFFNWDEYLLGVYEEISREFSRVSSHWMLGMMIDKAVCLISHENVS